MRITNKTHWRTDQLKAIIQRVADAELDTNDRKRLRVEAVYKKSNWRRCGLGAINGLWIRLYLNRDSVDRIQLAHTIAHEFAHNRGWRHRQMAGTLRYSYAEGWREYYAWAESLPLEEKEVKAKAKPDIQLVRYQRVLDAKKRWLTKAKRAATALKKLRAQERYYERALAAAGKLPQDHR